MATTRQPQRKHLMGGSLKTAMADEVKRVLGIVGGHRVTAAHELGISVRTLEKWIKKWDELSDFGNPMEAVLATKPKGKKKKAKKSKKTFSKKKSSTSAQARAA